MGAKGIYIKRDTSNSTAAQSQIQREVKMRMDAERNYRHQKDNSGSLIPLAGGVIGILVTLIVAALTITINLLILPPFRFVRRKLNERNQLKANIADYKTKYKQHNEFLVKQNTPGTDEYIKQQAYLKRKAENQRAVDEYYARLREKTLKHKEILKEVELERQEREKLGMTVEEYEMYLWAKKTSTK